MNSPLSLLAELEARDIRLSVAECKLRFSAPKGALTDELKARLAGEKAGIIALLEERAALADAPIPVQPRGRGLPLSAAQQRFWFLDRLDSGNSAAFVMPPVVLQLAGPLDAGALQRALQALVARHEVLRSAFRIEDDQPVQVPLDNVDVALPLHDLTALDAAAREAAVQETIRTQALTPFDLQRGEALLRAVLLRLAAQEHVFVLTLHHIIADGWSMGILVDELARLYRAALRNEPAASAGLAPLPVQYADYAAWERTHLAGAHLERLTEHWRGVLGDAPDFLELPTDRPRPRVRGNRGQVAHFACDAAFTARFNALCNAAGVTPYMALLACFGLLLCRYTDKEDLVVGTPISVRPHEQVAPLIGLFLNTVALRLDLTGNPDAHELLRRVRRTALAAYEHAEMPFEQLLQTLDIPRSLDHTPLFQVLFALQNAPLGEVALEGLKIAPRPTESLHSPFDLVLSMEETAQGLTGFFRYNTDLFERPTVARMAGHFQRLLEGLVTTPDTPVRELPMLGADELRQLQDWRGGTAQFPVSGTLTQRFAAQAARTPEAPALRLGDARMSYGELETRSNRVAQRLRRMGVNSKGGGDRVGLCAERSLELLVGLLGILKAGAAYVPLDPTYPPERLGFMAEDAGLAVLVCFGAVPASFSTVAAPGARRLDLADPTLADEPATALDDGAAGDIAYVIYTSGSTGRPKGVEVTHANVLRLFDCSQALFGYGAGDVWSLFHSYAFDFSVWELWGALLYGGEVVVVPYAVSRSPDQFLRLLGDSGVTMLSQTPSAFRQLIEADCRAPEQVPLALKWVVFGGEALDPRSLARWTERRGLDMPQLINMYGITETTVHVSFHRLRAEDIAQGGSVIGTALPDLSIDLVDSRGQPVPLGVPGEILVGGAGVARGYLNRPELTAQRFIGQGMAGDEGGRRYRSGDLARWRADGLLDYLGRIDLQVKIRGFRIELGEIEAALASHPAVSEAVVEAQQEGNGARLLAWVASPEWQDAELPARLREHLRTRLPDYMLPASLVALERLPLTGNGKLDRKALAALAEASAAQKVGAGETVANGPRSALERLLAELWSEVLGRPVASIDGNFFELGGDSIRAAILVNKIQDRLRSVVYVVALFEAPTIRALADYLRVHYPEALGRIDGESAEQGGDALPAVEEKDVATFAALIPPLPRFAAPGRKKNPRAIFVLSPPRSGSTLLRVLLGGHPALFSPPELELLGFESLGERARICSGRDAFWREGTLRAAMEALGLDADAAQALMAEREAADMSVADFYAELQGWLGPRLLVDKSPSYALDRATLQRAEDTFDAPLYLHLHRHPYGMIASFEEAKLDQIFFRYPHDYPTRRLAELIWLHSHRNIAAFLAGIPPERQLAVGFAEMTQAPAETARRLCDFIGIDYLPEMLDIHGGGRMTDGPRAESRMLGDVKFLSHKGIDPAAADRWREIYDRDFLGTPAWAAAEKLGYARETPWPANVTNAESAAAIAPVPRPPDVILPASFAQQRLWFLDQLEGAGAAYHMPVALRLCGALDVQALADSLAAVVRRHEVLRSRFETVDGAPLLRADVVVPAMECIDLSGLGETERAVELERQIRTHAEAPFDLARGPLFRAALLTLGAGEWVALLNMHHIVSDGWSMGVLAREWSALYNAAVNRQSDPLPALTIQYADYAAWQREHLSVTRQIDYWRTQLAGAPALLELPTDRPRPAVQRFAGDTLTVHYDAALGRRLKQLADQSGVSLYMLLLAAYAVLLMRHSGQRDIVIGSPTANRARSEVEPLIGFFVNTLVLRLPLVADQPFADFLATVRARALEAYAHQDVPFEQLVEELRPQRNLSYSPLFQVMFSLQNTPPVTPDLAGVAVEEIAVRQGMAKFDMTLSVTERAGALEAAFEYGTDLFDRSTIERLAGHYRVLLEGIAAAPERSVDRLPLLPADEERRMVDAWNRTATVYDPPYSIVGLFEAQAARTPEAIAVIFNGRRLSYAELDALAERYAARLRAAGLAANQLAANLVGICLRRAPEMLAALLAVQKCGCAYVPIDPAYPAERIRHVLDDAGTALLLTQNDLLPTLPDCACPVLCIDGGETGKVGAGRTVPAGDLAYVIYTSGSTGKPKGVMVGQRAAANFLRTMAVAPGIKPDDRVLAVTTISFDIAVLELYLPLSVGACVVIADEATTRDGEALMALLAQERITLAQATPATWRMLLDVGWAGDARLTILCGGEAFPADLARALLGRCGALWNMYGPTETTVWSTVQRVDDEALRHASIPIGRPIANTVIRILDAHGAPQPAGVTGELLIGGAGLAAGYLGRPELTAERFVPDPLDSGKLLYRTGDLARYLADGRIDYLGRGDQQVKVRGFRVELGEIEHVLGRQPGIAVCAVALDTAAARLVAYYCGTREENEDAELRRALAAALPDYMVPALYVKLEALPLTPNGKIDRNALRLPDGRGAGQSEAVLGFRDGIEQALVRIWEEVLAVRPIGIRDNFFELGGHSIIAVRLMARVAQEFGRKLPLASLFQGATVEAMARLLREEGDVGAAPRWSSLVPIRPTGEKPAFYCAAGAGGNVVYFHDLARALAPGQPFFGLQPPGLDGVTPPLPTVEALAAHYLETIRASGAAAPRIIGGHSFGGLIAFEMARQLAAGTVPPAPTFLILIDTPAPHFFHPTGNDWSDAEWLWQVAQIAEHLYGVALGLDRAELDDAADGGLDLLTRRMIAADVLPPGTGTDYLRGFIGVYRANLQAVYAPPPLAAPTRVLLLRSAEAQPEALIAEQFASMRETRELGWRDYLRGPLIVEDVPGDHLTMMRPPHVAALAALIEKHLEDAP